MEQPLIKRLEPTRKDLLQLKIQRRNHSEMSRKGGLMIQSSSIPPSWHIDYAKDFDCVDHNKLWKILQEKGISDHLTCLLRNLHADQEATVKTGLGTTDCFQMGKGVHQDCILSPCLFSLYAEYIMRNTGLGEISVTSGMQMTPPLWQRVKKN